MALILWFDENKQPHVTLNLKKFILPANIFAS